MQVTPHAIRRFRQRVAPVSTAVAARVLLSLATPCVTSGERRISATWRGVSFTVVLRGETLMTVWRN